MSYVVGVQHVLCAWKESLISATPLVATAAALCRNVFWLYQFVGTTRLVIFNNESVSFNNEFVAQDCSFAQGLQRLSKSSTIFAQKHVFLVFWH